MNALGASNLERTICATAGIVGTAMAHGISPEVDPEEWPHARHLLVWGWNPLSTAPHLWRKLLDARRAGCAARGGGSVPQPHGAGGRRAPAPAAGHGRRARHRDDAGDRGRRPPRRGLVPRPRRRVRRAARGAGPSTSVEECAASCGVEAEAIARVGREFATTRPALLRLGVGAQRHAGRSGRLLDDRLAARAHRRLAGPRRRAAPTSRIATAAAVSSHLLEREDLRPSGRCARSTCRSSARRSPTRSSTRR